MKGRSTIVLILLIIQTFKLYAQGYEAEGFEANLLEAKYGAMLVYNGERHSFTLQFMANKVIPTEQENFLRADGRLIQSVIIPFLVKLDFDNLSVEVQKKHLEDYRNYEIKYINESLKAKINVSSEFRIIKGKIFLLWSFKHPETDKGIDSHIYLTTICFDQMLSLSSIVETGKNMDEIKAYLLKTAETLELKNSRTDVNKLYTELRK